MDIFELVSESTTTLTVNKIRTGLAMLGVIIGIGSVIALMSLGQSSQKSITNNIQSLGANLLTIRPGAARSGGVRSSFGSSTTLTMDDAEAVAQLDNVQAIAPLISGNAQLVAGRNNSNNSVYGVTIDYPTVNNLEIASGSFFSTSQIIGLKKVAVVGPTVVEDLFGEGANAIGEKIRINNQSFTIIGVSKSKGGNMVGSADETVFVPITVAQKVLFGQDYLSSLSVSASNEEVMTQLQADITQLLMQRHQIVDEASADFNIMSQEEILSTMTEVTSTFVTLLSGIAAISLVVGGIGIMNIMLVTVTERTREIGLRKALGAKKKIIVYQFLIETILITAIGGIIGILMGVGVSYFLAKSMSLPFSVNGSSIGLAFGVSALIGLVFGIYPANKAANLQPIDALRYE